MTATTRKIDTRKLEEFKIERSSGPVGLNRPQKMGTKLWRPMFVMGLMGLIAAAVLAFVRASIIGDADPNDVDSIETLRHLVTGTLFIGFTAILAAISFAIARILGVFRVGGSEVQSDVGQNVETLKMPPSGKIFIGLMMMGMMAVAVGAISNIIVGLAVPSLDPADLVTSEKWYLFSVGLRRIGVGLYLTGITMGLVTIMTVIRFQAVRIRQLA
jgi:hypothetical protein